MKPYVTTLLLCCAIGLTSCNSPGFSGPPRLARLAHIDGGVGKPDFQCRNGVLTAGSEANQDSFDKFNLGFSFSQRVCASYASRDATETIANTTARAMLESGFTLVKTRCNDFFAVKAQRQTQGRLVRSLLQPVTIAITSALSVIDFGSEEEESDALTLLAAASTFALPSLDIYEEQFLFDADNIDAVRGLTMRALDTHRAGVVAYDTYTFDSAVRQLIDHQMICTPASVLELTRKAIEAGDVKPRTRTNAAQLQNDGEDEQAETATESEAVDLVVD